MTDTRESSALAGRYRLRERLGTGGWAEVFLAHDELLDRDVAVKRLHPHLAGDATVVERFRREATAAAAVNDPHVVAIHDVALDGTWLVMEHVDGHTLRDVVAMRGRLLPGQALSLLAPVAAGLAAAHDRGMVHRDVKPDNVLVGRDGTVKIGDFGLARAATGSPITFGERAFAGSPHYVAPEVVQSQPTDARTDVYALGIMLFELLAGRPPLDGDTPMAIAMAHLQEAVPAPSSVVPRLDPAVDRVVARATAKNPDDRYEDARAFARALDEAVPDGPLAVDLRMGEHATIILPVDLPPTVVVDRGRRRRPPRWLVLAVVVALLGAGGWVTWDRVLAPAVALDVAVGDDLAAASAALEDAGFRVSVAPPRTDPDVPEGAVLAVEPATTARRGSTVVLVPSAGPAATEVPRLTGFGEDAALTALTEAGLDAEVERDFSDTVPAGEVMVTDPAATTVVDEGTVVTVTVSQGREPLSVPDLVGRSLDEATATLTGLGLEVGTVQRVDDLDVPADHVVSQGETPGTVRFRGDRVGLVVSDGPPPFALPDVRGLARADAVATLEELGLEVEVVEVPTSQPDRVGTVDEQAPSADREVRAGEQVTLFVWVAG